MKKYMIIFFVIFFAISPIKVFAANLGNWETTVSLDELDSAIFSVVLDYNSTVDKSDYFIMAYAENIDVLVDNQSVVCDREFLDVGTFIKCNNIHGKSVNYRFRARGLINQFNNLNQFTLKLPVFESSDRFAVTVELPLKSVLADKSKLSQFSLEPFEPDYGISGTDGRIIFVRWISDKPKLGDRIDVSVFYEENNQSPVLWIVVIMIITSGLAFGIWFWLHKQTIDSLLPILNADEQRLVRILMEGKKPMNQKIIVKKMDYSKSKVSRIIQSLEERGILKRIPIGRTNLIKLTVGHKREERQVEK